MLIWNWRSEFRFLDNGIDPDAIYRYNIKIGNIALSKFKALLPLLAPQPSNKIQAHRQWDRLRHLSQVYFDFWILETGSLRVLNRRQFHNSANKYWIIDNGINSDTIYRYNIKIVNIALSKFKALLPLLAPQLNNCSQGLLLLDRAQPSSLV